MGNDKRNPSAVRLARFSRLHFEVLFVGSSARKAAYRQLAVWAFGAACLCLVTAMQFQKMEKSRRRLAWNANTIYHGRILEPTAVRTPTESQVSRKVINQAANPCRARRC